jgi:hypothetical protein
MFTITIIKDDVEYDISSIVLYDVSYSDDISKELDLADFIIPVTLSNTIEGLDLSVPFTQLTRVEFNIDGDIKRYYVREDDVETISLVTPHEYSHKVSLIEPTKLLELKASPDMAITQPKGDVGTASSQLDIDPDDLGPPNDSVTLLPDVYNLIDLANTTAPTDIAIIDEDVLKLATTDYKLFLEVQLQRFEQGVDDWDVRIKINGNIVKEQVVPVTINLFDISQGLITLDYTSSVVDELVEVEIRPNMTTTIEIDTYTYKVALTITTKLEDVTDPITYYDESIDKILESFRVSDINNTSFIQEITLNEDTRNLVSNIVTPEFTFETYSVWDKLEELAEPLKAIPRLSKHVWNELTFDFIDDLNVNEFVNTNKTEERQKLVLDKFSTSVEINADNVIESIENQAIKVEPYEGGWMTLRSETEGPNQLTDETVGLKVRSNIYQHKTVTAKGFTVGYSDASSDGPTTEWDISDYTVEEKKWLGLPDVAFESSRTTVNLGKGNTIYYTKSGRRFKSFGYRAPKATSISLALDLSIYQIIASVATQVSGKVVTSVNGSQSIEDLLQTQYNVQYSAFKKIRAKVYKHNARDFEFNTTLYSNARAKVNDNVKLGRYSQSLVNRSGNKTRIESGLTENYNDVPKTGNIINGTEVATKVNVILKNGLFEYGLATYEGYAEISEFVGINSEYRQWQVSDKDIVERVLVYEDFITVGRQLRTPTWNVWTLSGFLNLVKPFAQLSTDLVTYHTFQTRNTALNPGDANWETFDSESEGPVDIVAEGTSTIINVTVKDNFNVDDVVEGQELSGGNPTKWYQNNYNYTNAFGQYDSARYTFYTTGKVDNTVDDGNIYPGIDEVTSATKMLTYDLRVKKDSREASFHAFQASFFSDLGNGVEDLRVYAGIAKFNGLAIQDLETDIVPVLLINGYYPTVEEVTIKPTNYVETTMSSSIVGLIPLLSNKVVYDIDVPVTGLGRTYNGWALIDKISKELIFATNEVIPSSTLVPTVYEDTVFFTQDETKGK